MPRQRPAAEFEQPIGQAAAAHGTEIESRHEQKKIEAPIIDKPMGNPRMASVIKTMTHKVK
jgi:hypothetical protein